MLVSWDCYAPSGHSGGGEERNCFLHPLTLIDFDVGADEQYWCLAKGEHWLSSSRSKAYLKIEREREKLQLTFASSERSHLC